MARTKPAKPTFPSCTIKKVMIKKITIAESCSIDYDNLIMHEREVGLLASWYEDDLLVDLTIKPVTEKGQATFDGEVHFPNLLIGKVVVGSTSSIDIKKLKITPDDARILTEFRSESVQCNLRFVQKQGSLL